METVETVAKAFTTFLANYTVAMVLVITSLLHCTSTVHTIDTSSSSVCVCKCPILKVNGSLV